MIVKLSRHDSGGLIFQLLSGEQCDQYDRQMNPFGRFVAPNLIARHLLMDEIVPVGGTRKNKLIYNGADSKGKRVLQFGVAKFRNEA